MDAEGIAELFRTIYSGSHSQTKIEVVNNGLIDPNIASFVAVEDGIIAGHGQLRQLPEYPFTEYEKDGVEIARLGVHRDYQHQGVCKRLVDKLNQVLKKIDPGFVFSDFNTATDYSQRAMSCFDLKPVALMYGLSPDFTGIGQNNSFLVGMSIRDDVKDARRVYVPARYKELAELVYEGLGLERDVEEKDRKAVDLSSFSGYADKFVECSRKEIEEQGCTYRMFGVNLSSPFVISQIELALEKGLTVEGMVPLARRQDGKRADRLVLAYTPFELDHDKIKATPGLNREFVELVLRLRK